MSQTPIIILAASAPLAILATYLFYLNRTYAKQTTATFNISSSDATPRTSPRGSTYDHSVIAREYVSSHPIPIAELKSELGTASSELSRILDVYLQTTFRAFSWTPQAILMQWMIKDPAIKRSFNKSYLKMCKFEAGDRVCGLYVVSERLRIGGDRVILELSPPVGWTGPVVEGNLNVGYKLLDEEHLKFVNETVMFRSLEENPTLLEGRVGRWLHRLLARWLIIRGVQGVRITKAKKL